MTWIQMFIHSLFLPKPKIHCWYYQFRNRVETFSCMLFSRKLFFFKYILITIWTHTNNTCKFKWRKTIFRENIHHLICMLCECGLFYFYIISNMSEKDRMSKQILSKHLVFHTICVCAALVWAAVFLEITRTNRAYIQNLNIVWFLKLFTL